MRKVLPLVLVAVVTAVATWLLVRTAESPTASPSPTRPPSAIDAVDPAESSPTGLRLVRECLTRLDKVEASLDRCEEKPPPIVAEGEAAEQCLHDPQIRAAIAREVERELERRLERIRDRKQTAKATTELAIDDWAKGLGLDADQREWMREYTCSLEELRTRALDALAADQAPPDDVLGKLRERRESVLADLEAKLGAERYGRLRALGGIGLLRDSIDCA